MSCTRLLDPGVDAVSALASGGFAWFHDGRALCGGGVAARITVEAGTGRLERAADRVAEVLGAIASDDPLRVEGTGPVAVGALPFSDAVAGELVVPAVVIGRMPTGQVWVTETGAASESDARHSPVVNGMGADRQANHGAAGGGFGFDRRGEWDDAVRRVLARIDAGDLTKAVLARQVVAETVGPIDPAVLVRRLRARNPECYTFAAGAFVGSSPELLVRRSGRRVVSTPMAGTAERGSASSYDEQSLASLRSSVKERAEHSAVVSAVRDALGPVCSELSSPSEPEVVELATVAHLATTVSGVLAEPAPSALALAGLLHPTPAVGGCPTRAALAVIAELEPFDRGLYAGPVGWVDARGDGEWAVALRCAQLDGATATLTAGAGIVAGSDPTREWDETEAKLRAMLDALEA